LLRLLLGQEASESAGATLPVGAYNKALLHVRAAQHFRTGDLRNIQLITFVDYQPTYNEEALDRFTAKGQEAWADVPDAAKWVREVRGALRMAGAASGRPGAG